MYKHSIIHGRHRFGRYCVTPHVQNSRALVEWIEACEFRRFENEQYHLKRCFGRRRSQLYGIPLPGMRGEAVMKMSTIHPAYKLSRRTELFLRSLYRDYNKAAFKYALALLNAGAPVAEPFAFWSDWRSRFDRRSYLLCRKVPGEMTLYDLLQKISQPDDEAAQHITHSIRRRLIEIMRKMHTANLRHGDPHPNNILVNTDLLPEQITAESAKTLPIFFIDFDRCSSAYVKWSPIKEFFDLRDMAEVCRWKEKRILAKELPEILFPDGPTIWQRMAIWFWCEGGLQWRQHSATRRKKRGRHLKEQYRRD